VRDVLALLTPRARLVLSRFKEGAGALSLAEMAIVIEPGLSGIPLEPELQDLRKVRERWAHPVDAQLQPAARSRYGPRKPLEKRMDGLGNALPGLEEREDWRAAYILARAVITELDALGLLVPVRTRGDTPAKWTTTPSGDRVARLTSVKEWRREARKSRA